MDAAERIEQALLTTIDTVAVPSCPPRLIAAMRHAVFPGGARVRPRLTLAVAQACGEDDPLRHRCRRLRDRADALRLAGARRPAVLRRCRDAARQAVRAQGLRRAARRAVRRCADPARLPGDRPARACPAAARAAGDDLVARHRRAVRHHRRPGLGMRAAHRPAPLSSRQDRRAVRRRGHRRRGGGRRRGGAVAHARRDARARPTRPPTTSAMPIRTRRNAASRSAAMPRSAAPTRSPSSASTAPSPGSTRSSRKASPRSRRAAARRRCGRSSSTRRAGCCPRASPHRSHHRVSVAVSNPANIHRAGAAEPARALVLHPQPPAGAQPGFQRWASTFPPTRPGRARAGRRACSISAPASSIRRSCSPASS